MQQIEDGGALTWVGACNELNASYAADIYARLNGIAALAWLPQLAGCLVRIPA